MSRRVSIRPPTADELPAVCVLAGKLVRQHHAFDPDRFMCHEPVEEGYEWFLGTQLTNKRAVVLAAFSGKRCLGYAYGSVEGRDWAMLLERHGALHDLYVDESARGEGIATRLVEEMLSRLGELGAPRFVLHSAWANERAQGFFEAKFGFRRTMVEMTREAEGQKPTPRRSKRR